MIDRDRPTLLLSVCLRCRDGLETGPECRRGGTRFAAAIARAAAQRRVSVGLRGVRCMSQCRRPCVIGLSGEGRFTYLFGDLCPIRHAAAVLDLVERYAQAPEGFLTRDERPEPLRASILGRMPPIGSASKIIEALDLELEVLA